MAAGLPGAVAAEIANHAAGIGSLLGNFISNAGYSYRNRFFFAHHLYRAYRGAYLTAVTGVLVEKRVSL